MAKALFIFILLFSSIIWAAPNCREEVSPVVTEEKKDETPIIMEDFKSRADRIQAGRELNDFLRERAERLESSGLSEPALSTHHRVFIGRIIKLIENGQVQGAVDQARWIWNEIVRTYRTNEDIKSRIEDATQLMNDGQLKIDEGQEIVAKLEAEEHNNKVVFTDVFPLYRGVSGFLINAKRGIDPETSAAEGAAKTVLPTLTAMARSKPLSDEEFARTANAVKEKLDEQAAEWAAMFPDFNFPTVMPEYAVLKEYLKSMPDSVYHKIAYLKKERSADRWVSIQLFILSDVVLGPVRSLVTKFLPVAAQAHVFNVLDMGYDRASILRYLPATFQLFHVKSNRQLADFRERNAATNDQYMIALARMFPRFYLRLMLAAREEGLRDMKSLGETPPENLLEVPDKKDRPVSSAMNFYYRMVVAQKAANILGDLSIDHNNDKGQRRARYAAAGAATAYGVYSNWGSIGPAIQKLMDYLR